MASTLCVLLASAAQPDPSVGAPPPTPVPTPAPGLGEALVDFYSDAYCTENRLLYTVRFPNADGYCGESGRQWFVEGVSGQVNQWGAAFCDFRRQKLFMQLGIGDQKTCGKEISSQDKIAGLKTAFSVALDDKNTHGCNKWDMPDPNNGGVVMTVGTRLREGSCVPPTGPPGGDTSAPGGSPPSQCGVWPKDRKYGCSGGSAFQQLSASGDQVECTVDCLDIASREGSDLCCYLADVGCFASLDGKVVEGGSNHGLAIGCKTNNPHPGPSSGTPSPGSNDGGGGGTTRLVIIACAAGGSVLLLATAAAVAWYLRRTGRLDSLPSCSCCSCCRAEEDSGGGEELPLLSRIRSRLCCCCRGDVAEEETTHDGGIFAR
eukprot:Hpha_TRINITY_DN27058_c0_g1::TRINITY_DN27058_c0_g1_i1::g.33213::m.33213